MLADLSKHVKHARKQAVLGQYKESLSQYEKVIGMLDTYISTSPPSDALNQTKLVLLNECKLINNHISTLRRFKTTSGPVTQIIEDNHPIVKNLSPKKEFGSPQYNAPANNRDPDIWLPPQPKPSYYIKKNPPRQPPQRPTPPWAPAKTKVNPKGAKTSGFLEHVYPDGVGPDTELIKMLERDVLQENPSVYFEDIADLDETKQLLQEAVLLPILMPEFFKGIRRPWRGVLMYGPPGTGKTMLAKSIATLGQTTFFNVSLGPLVAKWRGESEKLLRLLFKMARFYAPSTIFFDEIDSIGSGRGYTYEHETTRRLKTELLVQMDGVTGDDDYKHRIIILAATNRPWDLDEAFRRRLEKRIYIPLPGDSGRRQMFEIFLSSAKLDPKIDWKLLIKKSNGYSGADIADVCREAALMPMRKYFSQIRDISISAQVIEKIKNELHVPLSMQDLEDALESVNRSVSDSDLEHYKQWIQDFGSI